MALWTDLRMMFEDIEKHARKYKLTFLWADDIGRRLYGIVSNPAGYSWHIPTEHATAPGLGGSDKVQSIRQALRTQAGKEALLKALNNIKNLPPLPPQTVWERIASDD